MHIHVSKRKSKSLPKVPRDFCNDTAWGHAMFRKKYSKAVWLRTKYLRYFFKKPKFICAYNESTKSLIWEVKY